jgi:hypothetical protein
MHAQEGTVLLSHIAMCQGRKEEGFPVMLSSVDTEGSCWHPASNCIPSFPPSFDMEVDKQCRQCSTLHSTPWRGSELEKKVNRVEIFFYARNLSSSIPSNNSNKGKFLVSLHNLDKRLVGLINSVLYLARVNWHPRTHTGYLRLVE